MEQLDPDKCYIQINIAHDTIVEEFAIALPRYAPRLKTKQKELLVCVGKNITTKWSKKERPNGQWVSRLVEGTRKPDRYRVITVLKRPKKEDPSQFRWQAFTHFEESEERNVYIPVVCTAQLTESLFRKISERLYTQGYSEDFKETTLSYALQLQISAFEYDQCLPSHEGQISLLTLEALEINIEK